jgi:hypothetical protein
MNTSTILLPDLRPFKAQKYVSFIGNEFSIISEPGNVEVANFEAKTTSWSMRWDQRSQLELYGITNDGIAVLQAIWACDLSDKSQIIEVASNYIKNFTEKRLVGVAHISNSGFENEFSKELQVFEKYPFQVRVDEFTYNYLSDRGTEKFVTFWNGKDEFQVFSDFSDDQGTEIEECFHDDYQCLEYDDAEEELEELYLYQKPCDYAKSSSFLNRLEQLTQTHWFVTNTIEDRCTGNPRDVNPFELFEEVVESVLPDAKAKQSAPTKPLSTGNFLLILAILFLVFFLFG